MAADDGLLTDIDGHERRDRARDTGGMSAMEKMLYAVLTMMVAIGGLAVGGFYLLT